MTLHLVRTPPLDADSSPRILAVLHLLTDVLEDIAARPLHRQSQVELEFFSLFADAAPACDRLQDKIRDHWGQQVAQLQREGGGE